VVYSFSQDNQKDLLARDAIVVLMDKVAILEKEVTLLKEKDNNTKEKMSKYIVMVKMANIRVCPSTSCLINYVAKEGEVLNGIKNLSNGWLMLDGQVYIHASLVKKI
jgi:hypothetical protein